MGCCRHPIINLPDSHTTFAVMEFLPELIQAYSDSHTDREPELLTKISRETHLNVLMPRMLSGHFQGRVLSMISNLIRPERILEIGTYTGYSALCLAEGLSESGTIFTIDKNGELKERVQGYFQESGKADKIEFMIGNALDIIPALHEKWDLVFIDADKSNYLNYYEMVVDQVRSGGIILADNVLWSGKVVDDKAIDKDTKALRKFNNHVHNDPRVANVLLPVRDGLMILRKQ